MDRVQRFQGNREFPQTAKVEFEPGTEDQITLKNCREKSRIPIVTEKNKSRKPDDSEFKWWAFMFILRSWQYFVSGTMDEVQLQLRRDVMRLKWSFKVYGNKRTGQEEAGMHHAFLRLTAIHYYLKLSQVHTTRKTGTNFAC
jgi:hypothetical protein